MLQTCQAHESGLCPFCEDCKSFFLNKYLEMTEKGFELRDGVWVKQEEVK